MMNTGIVTRDDSVWQGHPDVAFFQGRLFVAYRCSDRHKTASETKVQIVSTEDFAIDQRMAFSTPYTLAKSRDRFNCPRLSVIDGILYCVCDKVNASNEFVKSENATDLTSIWMWHTSDGVTWDGPIETGITGIVPDRLIKHDKGYLIATHTKDFIQPDKSELPENPIAKRDFIESYGNLVQNVWHAHSIDGPWTSYRLAENTGLNLCEASILRYGKGWLCFMRENSGLGLPAYICSSSDGLHWSKLVPTRLAGCHRPVSGALRSGKILTTYREQSHSFGKGTWAKNTFACLSHPQEADRGFPRAVILPLDHDTSRKSDSGYTGWVQLPDDSIFIVNYITNDAPKPYIKWYLVTEEEF